MDDDLRDLVRRALDEDAAARDITTVAIVPEGARGAARLVAKEPCVLAGVEVFAATFRELDQECTVAGASDGTEARAGDVLGTVEGPLRAILTAERTALNFVRRLSGIATLTRAFVAAARGTEIRDTRKTTPGLRALEKAAVRAGGGTNHRATLADQILIKDNHVAVAGGVEEAVRRARGGNSGAWVEVECDTLDQVRAALAAGADELLLDNMDVETLSQAVKLVNGSARTEASGNVTLDNVAAIAATGVDSISVGAITHSAPSADLSLEIEVA